MLFRSTGDYINLWGFQYVKNIYTAHVELSTITRTWANQLDIQIYANDNSSSAITCELFQVELLKYGTQTSASAIQYATPFTTTAAVQDYPNVIGTTGKTIRRVYLDGELLDTADWTYDNITDILTFVIVISGASEVQIDYQ